MSLSQNGRAKPRVTSSTKPAKHAATDPPRSHTTTVVPMAGPRLPAGPIHQRHVHIGLDFGTSSTKVVVQLEDATSRDGTFHLLGHANPHPSYGALLYPSSVRCHQRQLYFGHDAEHHCGGDVVRSFKMHLPLQCGESLRRPPISTCSSPRPGYFLLGGCEIGAEDLSSLYMANVLRVAKEAVRQRYGPNVDFRVNSAAPLDQIASGGALKESFERVLFYANLLSNQAKNPWSLADALNALERVKEGARDEDLHRYTSVFPETHAAMAAFLLASQTRTGKYATVDIGAGSTDVAFFWFHRTAGLPEACFFSAQSEFVGMDQIDLAVANARTRDRNNAREDREAMPASQIAQHMGVIYPVVQDVYKHFGKVFREAFKMSPQDRFWLRDDPRRRANGRPRRHANYTVLLVGGGAQFPPLREEMSKPLPSCVQIDNVRVEVPELPAVLELLVGGKLDPVPTREKSRLPLMLLAFGLAHRAIDIPQWETNYGFTRPPPVRLPMFDCDDRYGK